MKQNRESRNGPPYIWSINLQQKHQGNPLEKKNIFNKNGYQKNKKTTLDSYTKHKN